MAIEDGVVNKSGLVQASSNFQPQRSNRALTSFESNTFNELPDRVIFDSIQQCNRIHTAFEGNFINDLPDHILVLILSLLNPKEAARTSILSHRWRNLWTFTSRLVFDDLLLVREMQSRKVMKSLKVQRSRFINWANNTLKFHQGTTIDDFKVCFDVGKRSFKSDIDGWIVFALEKRVQSLHLDFRSTSEYLPCGSYTLTTQFLSSYTVNSLKDLHLIAVEVTGEVVEYILSACPLLEVLSVQASESLVRLKVSGPSLKLKNLEILKCPLKYIEISATNLMSFSYLGGIITGAINNVPRLVEASISGTCAPFLVRNIFQFSGVLSRLETLVLDLAVEIFRRFPKFPKLKNLKHLELILDGYHAESLLFCANLLKVSPLLHRFTLKVVGLATFQIYRKVKEQETKQPHRCLKVIEFIGFVGCTADTELLLCLLKRAVTLKKLMIDPCAKCCFGERTVCKDPELISKARSRAKQLETRLPPSAELVIL